MLDSNAAVVVVGAGVVAWFIAGMRERKLHHSDGASDKTGLHPPRPGTTQ